MIAFVFSKRSERREGDATPGYAKPGEPEFVGVGFGKSFDLEPLYRAGRLLEAKAKTHFAALDLGKPSPATLPSDPEAMAMLDLASLLRNLGSTSPLIASLSGYGRRLRSLPDPTSKTPANLGVDLTPLRALGTELLDRAKTDADTVIDARVMYDLGRLLQHTGDTSPIVTSLIQRGREKGLGE